MKTLLCCSLLLLLSSFASAQEDSEKVEIAIINDSTTLKIQDTLIVNIPASYEFTTIEEQKKNLGLGRLKQIGDIGGALGFGVAMMGTDLSSLQSGIKIVGASSIITSAGMASDAIDDLNVSKKSKSIIGKKLIITELHKYPISAIDHGYFAITKMLKSKKKYKIYLVPALYSKEVITMPELRRLTQ